jgi:hypothetical protein
MVVMIGAETGAVLRHLVGQGDKIAVETARRHEGLQNSHRVPVSFKVVLLEVKRPVAEIQLGPILRVTEPGAVRGRIPGKRRLIMKDTGGKVLRRGKSLTCIIDLNGRSDIQSQLIHALDGGIVLVGSGVRDSQSR